MRATNRWPVDAAAAASSVAAAGGAAAPAASTIAAPPAAATAGGASGVVSVPRIDTTAEHTSTTSATGLSTPHELRRPSEPHWGVSTSSADAQGDADSDS